MSYGKVHRFLLRSVASRGVITMPETLRALTQFSGEGEQESVQDLIKDINDAIRPYQQAIKLTTDELTNEEILVFLSLGYDDATKAQNLFTANELEFFRLLIEQIMTTESRQLTRISAINIVGAMKSTFTKTDAEKLLKTLCRMKYLDKENNNYALGVRAIHEFESYLRQNMPDAIEECHLCKNIVFRGFNCPACAKAIHTRCLNRYVEKVEKWPCCKTDYSADQIEQMNADSSRLSQTQGIEMTQSLTEANSEGDGTAMEETAMEATAMESTEDIEVSQQSNVDLSQTQRSTRKRKRQFD